MVDWIREAFNAIIDVINPKVIINFRFLKQEKLKRYSEYFKAIRSFVVAHPLNTTNHKAYGLDGNFICVDIREDIGLFPWVKMQDKYVLTIDGLRKEDYRDMDFYLYCYSDKDDNMSYFKKVGCRYSDIYETAKLYIEKLYLKSRRNNFLDQKIIRNCDEDTYLYVKGDFEPIISEEQWDRCRQIREQRVRQNKILTENGEKSHLTGVHTSDDVWTKKLRCRCGYRMRRNKWRKNRNGELIYGYKCYNQLNNGTKTTRQQAGVDDSGFCDLKEICDWKLEMMASRIFSGLWGNKKDILNKVSSLYQVGVFMEYREAETVKNQVAEQLAGLDEKLKKLTRMRQEDEITRESYFEFKSEIEKENLDLLSKRRVLDAGMVPN